MTAQRGETFPRDGYQLTATVRPSAILGMPDDRRHETYDDFVADLAGAARLLQ